MTTTMATYSGGTFNFAAPVVGDVELVDIAHGLSHTARFGGQARRFYSVAEHSVLVLDLLLALYPGADMDLRRGALLHDAHEAYVGDVPTPLKGLLGQGYLDIALAVDIAVVERFGLVPADLKRAEIKEADRRAMVTEGAALMSAAAWDWARVDTPLAPVGWVAGLWPVAARTLFLQRAKELGL